jgi:hypothetical protein
MLKNSKNNDAPDSIQKPVLRFKLKQKSIFRWDTCGHPPGHTILESSYSPPLNATERLQRVTNFLATGALRLLLLTKGQKRNRLLRFRIVKEA